MRGKRSSAEKIIGILKEAEAGISVQELCRKHGMSDGMFYNWKAIAYVIRRFGLSVRRACGVVGFSRTSYRHTAQASGAGLHHALRAGHQIGCQGLAPVFHPEVSEPAGNGSADHPRPR